MQKTPTCLPQPTWATADAIRDSCAGRALRGTRRNEVALGGEQGCQPAHDQAYYGDAPPAVRRGYQHDPGVARPSVTEHDEHLRGGGPGDEGESLGELRGGGGGTREALAQGRGADGVP